MAVQANEFRIGNWIQYIHQEGYMQVIDLKEREVRDDKIRFINSLLPEHILPITITPEILERCGFEWETENKTHIEIEFPDDGMELKRGAFYYNNGICEMFQIYQCDYFDGQVNIKPPLYLHQLQNLYYALTSQELTLEPLNK